MNYRQKRKKFKQKYGATPEDLVRDLNNIIPPFCDTMNESLANAINAFAEVIHGFVSESLPVIMEEVLNHVQEYSARIKELEAVGMLGGGQAPEKSVHRGECAE